MFIDRFRTAAFETCRLDPSLPLLAGISGGPDSLCLLDCLQQAGFQPVVAHFDHCLRPESGRDAHEVAEIASRRGLVFELGRLDVKGFSAEQRLSIEEAARNARYRFLFAAARAIKAQAVLVGHTADDQVETVLMHLLRGAGLAGLKGMTALSLHEGWDASIPLARPLLGIWRSEIEDYCRERGLVPLQDASNQDTTYYRNRLRHELIPYLASYNPQVKDSLWRTADLLAGDAEVLEGVVAQAWQDTLARRDSETCALSREKLLALPLGLQRGLLRRAIETLRPTLRDISFETVERGLKFVLHSTRTGSMSLAQGLRLEMAGELVILSEEGTLWVDAAWPQVPKGAVLRLEAPGLLDLGRGWVLRAEWADPTADYASAGRWEAWLDGDRLTLPLGVRGGRAGERIQPLGMDGHAQKLSDLWVNEGLPRQARAGWPLVVSGGEVAWVPGYRLDQRFRVTEKTERALYLNLKHDSA